MLITLTVSCSKTVTGLVYNLDCISRWQHAENMTIPSQVHDITHTIQIWGKSIVFWTKNLVKHGLFLNINQFS